MKTNEIIKADVFIDPNRRSFKVTNKTFEWIRSDLFRIFHANHLYENKEFLDQKWVQIWFVTRGDNDEANWFDNGIDGFEELIGWIPAAQYLPKSLFEGHKEGDVITIILPIYRKTPTGEEYSSIKIELCLKQQDYKYKSFGKFEKVLARI